LELYPLWMPDGRRLMFDSSQQTTTDIFRKAVDGSGTLEPLTTRGSGGYTQTISPDGRFLVYRTLSVPVALSLLPLDGSGPSKPLMGDPRYNYMNAEISPDGRWIAYDSNESGSAEVYVRPFPAIESGRWQISSGGGNRPAWSRSGRELFFLSPQPHPPVRVMATPIQSGASFTFGKPQPLFDVTGLTGGGGVGRNYDVAPDGRFLFIRAIDEARAGQPAPRPSLVVVTHWVDEVRGRVK